MAKSKELLQEMGEITKEMRDLVDRVDNEKRARTAEEEDTLKRHNERLDQIEKDIETHRKIEEREAFLAQPASKAIKPSVTSTGSADDQMADRMKLADAFEKRYGDRGKAIFSRMAENPLASTEYRDA